MPDPNTGPSTPLKTNVLYYGDNLDVLRKYVPDASVDLIYLDPPFNSSRSYNVLFRESGGASSEAQIEAFEDTWEWGPAAARAYEDVVTGPHQQVARMLKAMVEGLGRNPVTAYLTMMASRLVELHRVLKPTGSLYLHCDPTASHYLKMLLDAVFGPTHFLNEVVWKRTYAHSGAKRFGPVHDIILSYAKTASFTWNHQKQKYSEEYKDSFFRFTDSDGRRYRSTILTGSGLRSGESGNPWRGVNPSQVGRHWAVPGYVRPLFGDPPPNGVHEALDRLDQIGRIIWPQKIGGTPSFKQYIDDLDGVVFQDVWNDIPPLSSQSKERLGYATQKPLDLLERIIRASSNPGDVVLDPFCGCGTAVHAAQKLGRRWIGIDITYLAIGLIRRRMQDAFPSTGRSDSEESSDSMSSGQAPGLQIEEIGAPVDLNGAKALAEHDKYQFQWWALDRLGAQPVSGRKKGADQGIDGVIPFVIGGTAAAPQYARVIVSVKGGGVGVPMVRDLIGVLQREKEPIGVVLTLEPPTGPMRREAASAGIYHSEFWQKDYPRVQIITIEELLHGKLPEMPPSTSPFAQAPRERQRGKQLELG